MAGRRGFGELERRTGRAASVSREVRDAGRQPLLAQFRGPRWTPRVARPERSLIDRDEWTPPKSRKVAEARRKREPAINTVQRFAERYVAERGLRPNTVCGYGRCWRRGSSPTSVRCR